VTALSAAEKISRYGVEEFGLTVGFILLEENDAEVEADDMLDGEGTGVA
jgi:hypothetical protein